MPVNVSQLTKQSADLTEKGFGLKDQDGNIVHKSLGEDIEVTGDGKNISTKVENGTMKVVLNDDLNVCDRLKSARICYVTPLSTVQIRHGQSTLHTSPLSVDFCI